MYRLLELFKRRLQPAVKPAGPVEPSFQIALIRSWVPRVLANQRLPWELGERDFEPVDDAPGDFVLHGKHIGNAAIVPLGPEMAAIFGADQLRGDSHAVSSLSYGTLQRGVDVEQSADVLDIGVGPVRVKGRRSRCDAQPRNLTQTGQELFRESRAEVLEIFVGSEALERQHGDRRDPTAPATHHLVRHCFIQRILKFQHAAQIFFHGARAPISTSRVARKCVVDDPHEPRGEIGAPL